MNVLSNALLAVTSTAPSDQSNKAFETSPVQLRSKPSHKPTLNTKTVDWSKEALDKVAKEEYKNRVSFSILFTTDDGTPCPSCLHCEDSNFSTIFDPLVTDACIDCESADNGCNRIKHATTFESE